MFNRGFPQTTNQKRVVEEIPVTLPTNSHVGGCYCPTNGKVYFAPYQSDFILEYDPVNKTSRNISLDTDIIGTVAGSGSDYFQGAVYHPNGKIYFCTYSATHVAIYDVDTDSLSYVFITNFPTEGKWNGIVVANNGDIYLIPWQWPEVCKIDTTDDSISFFGAGLNNRGLGGVLAENGKIYQPPSNSSSFTVIDPSNDTTSTFGNLGAGGVRWINGCNDLDGNIWFAPLLDNRLLKLDPINETSELINITGLSGSVYYANLQLAPNGRLYGFPYLADRIVEIIPERNEARTFYLNGSNTYHGNTYCEQGIIPVNRVSDIIKRLENIGIHKQEMITIPANVADMSTSLWNKFHQTL